MHDNWIVRKNSDVCAPVFADNLYLGLVRTVENAIEGEKAAARGIACVITSGTVHDYPDITHTKRPPDNNYFHTQL
jgi:hypothetical protein